MNNIEHSIRKGIKSMNVVVITGASSGIGREFALQMDSYFPHIDEFWLIARRRKELEKTAALLKHKTRILSMDITKDAQLERLEDTLRDKHAVVRMLINCAGYGIMGAFAEQDRGGELGMVRLNCEALTNITHRLIPYMRRGSRIIQLASGAAFLPQEDFAVYAASKAYVLSFSKALHQELLEQEIYVTAVCPGPVDTPFFDIAERTGSTLAIKKFTMVDARRVVKDALRDSYNKRSISVCSLPIKAFRLMSKIVPSCLLLSGTKVLKHHNKKP